ncbi:MAG: VOC family protein [Nocardioides sp.]
MNTNDPNRTRDFYARRPRLQALRHALGRAHGRDDALHAVQRLAPLASPSPAARTRRVHHVSFEMRGLDEYLYGTGRVMRAGIKKIWGPGRHHAGNNTFTYFLDPSGNTMEYTTELERLTTDEWHPSVYDIADPNTQDLWGIADPISEFIARDSFNDVDRGVFVAPPV